MSLKLIHAIRAGDFAGVQRLLAEGADPNVRIPDAPRYGAFLDQVTPLMVAVAAPQSNADIVRLLLAHSADPFPVSAGDVSSTWYACGGGTGTALSEEELQTIDLDHPYRHWGGGDAERLGLLLDAGGDPNECAANGRSCVYEASCVGDHERLRLLLERGAVLSTDHKLVPLFAASSAGSLECVKLIVEAGFPANFVLDDNNALATVGNVEVAEYLWEQGVRPTGGSFGFDVIDNAIENDDMRVLRFFLGKASPDMIQQKLLMASGAFANPRAVRMLLEMGAKANEPSPHFGSPLHYICWKSNSSGELEEHKVEEVIQILIDAGADLNLLSNGRRPLHDAAAGDGGSPIAVRVLLRNGVDIDATNEKGHTALMFATFQGYLECARLLIEAGADRTLKDNAGKTALEYAHDRQKSIASPSCSISTGKKSRLLSSLGFESEEELMQSILSTVNMDRETLRRQIQENAQALIDLLSE